MTVEEFSNEFDVLINSYNNTNIYADNHDSLVFDEYEKSVFLTRAQEELVTEIYKGSARYNSFESSEESRRILNCLVETKELQSLTSDYVNLTNKSQLFSLPEDTMFITYEAVVVIKEGKESTLPVIPVSQDTLHKILENPFKGLKGKRALRLDTNNNTVELICNNTISKYILRYLKYPTPIILANLVTDGLESISINGYSSISECKLNDSIHKDILDRAVALAIASKK